MVKNFNSKSLIGPKNKVFAHYLKMVLTFSFITIFIFAALVTSVLSASPSEGGVYNPYNDPEDFDPGFDFDCDSCDYDYDDDNDSNNDDEPDATTRSASSVGSTSATLNARIDGNGSSTRAWFEFGRDKNLDDETSEKSVGSGNTDLSIRLSGLRSDTLYYFRVVARNSEGTDAGSIMSFRTDNGNNNDNDEEIDGDVPSARTDMATFVTSNSAQLNSFIRDSGSNRTNVWFEWGTSYGLGNQTAKVSLDASPSATHRATIYGLAPGVTYYFRAVAENEDWRNNGTILSFTTVGGNYTYIPPKVTPPPASGGTTVETPAPAPTPAPVVEEPEEPKSGLVANVLGFGFFPSTLLGWMAFILLVLVLYILGRKYLFAPEHSHTVEVQDHHHH